MKTRNEIFLTFVRPGYPDIALGETSVAQTPGHRFGSRCDVANGVGGVDLDELLGDVVGQLLRLILTFSSASGEAACDQTNRHDPAYRGLPLHSSDRTITRTAFSPLGRRGRP